MVKLHPMIANAEKSWHVIDDVQYVSHTATESLLEEWAEIYSAGEAIVEVVHIKSSNKDYWLISVDCWYNCNGVFTMSVSEVSKEVALQMFSAAFAIAMKH